MANINELEEIVKNAKVGTIVPVYKILDVELCPIDYFAKLTNYGEKNNSILLESGETVKNFGENSIGTADPCLRLVGRGDDFRIEGLNELGHRFLDYMKGDFDFCDAVNYRKGLIEGTLKPERSEASESERLNQRTHMDIIRKVAFKFAPTLKPILHYGGLFGAFAYDFVDQFEDLPRNKNDVVKDPEYEMFFADNLFMYDHLAKQIHFVANALVMDEDGVGTHRRSLEKIEEYESFLHKKLIKPEKSARQPLQFTADISKKEYCEKVRKLKDHIVEGDIFQAVLSRSIMAEYHSEPLDIYKRLRETNPSPYMFFMKSDDGILLGSSPEKFISVRGDNSVKMVEIKPIAGTKPRGLINEVLDRDLDNRFETELKIDPKELAEHTMLVDLARNDVARISVPGTRHVSKPFAVEKYSHVQHMVSSVSGTLKPELDALHAYSASMNMGTLTGAPKIEAMKLLREYEENKRGFYGGSVFYLTPSKDLGSAIVIRSMRLKGDTAYIRSGAGIVYDSVPEKEFDETEKKAQACLNALRLEEENE